MKKKNRIYIIILVLIVLGLILIPIILMYKPQKSNNKDYELKELKVGETYQFVTLKEIKDNFVVINFNYNSVECGAINKDFNLTKDVLTVHQHPMVLEEIKKDSVVIKFLGSFGWC